jgi:predicted phosphodiesterase
VGVPALIGVVSDIHANLAALQAVVADAGPVDAWWCLGDIVGYGPEPAACLIHVREQCELIIAGNHDRGVTGELPPTHFNATARQAISWTRAQLSDEQLIYLANLSLREEPAPFTLVHGSPRFPLEEYVLTNEQAHASMLLIDTPHLIVGHSHLQCLWTPEIGFVPSEVDETGESPWLSLAAGQLLINPGSVGQPRDGDARAAYLRIDERTGRFQFRRVAYSIATTQRALHKAGLPASLSERLNYGI